ncbi:serine/threonine-protein phosphatase 6 regulatory ankyrin repeat subunit C isoform X2 [Lingula anatina]|uniref:Serine/threonine-protein phosphatase 6 regulatory ankyrin repeat subunit C isoform X1 n=1 Tax=Lingula anatina TaxID=7574 RepID=A0A1S3ILG3_LINAN|nr:serine/threonine-protein phosphatase 6 regulatory ankyrin repeat subunit C isoform X1 [Lingula anatina]XP_013398732.1 serine/threonine-protein phosphatase 6 regulatory ankyrin repeat subunit C isoform X2 [Lingula anatina]|eukprot:XP_013398731.1 serine/threonine-protein phosphatase 6 regulatory ankyrin repeat subunit C isoform X1 [Lingula anatina]
MAGEQNDPGASIMQELQEHLRTANIPLNNLSSIAQKGDDKLVEQFLSENIELESAGPNALQSQLYIACFWGVKDIARALLMKGADVNARNSTTLWTPLHAATFQEHGPVVMLLLDNGADPNSKDAEGRSPKDFASASEKIWPHFAALNLTRTRKQELVEMGIIKKVDAGISPKTSPRQPGDGIRLASYSRPESAYAYSSDPFMNAAMNGDVLAEERTEDKPKTNQPQFAMWK